MNIIIFCHPAFEKHQSMPRYARLLSDGLTERGHTVACWSPKPFFHSLGWSASSRKWLGYIDQFILFPLVVKLRMNKLPKDTLYVFADQALGPWVPLVSHLPHVIHCHDFLAQRSALGEFAMNFTSKSGKIYQSYIRRGYLKGQNFVSVSGKTRDDLHHFLGRLPPISEVIYNGLNQNFSPPCDPAEARTNLENVIGLKLNSGFLLHVGGNTWYKNRLGVMEIYEKWRELADGARMPLLMIGQAPTATLKDFQARMTFGGDVHFLSKIEDSTVRLAYQAASAFLFPSHEEGFGWPIAEAMASGCLVLTTDAAPMTEVAGNAAELIPRRREPVEAWAAVAARQLEDLVNLRDHEKTKRIVAGIVKAKQFCPEVMLDAVEQLYKRIAKEVF